MCSGEHGTCSKKAEEEGMKEGEGRGELFLGIFLPPLLGQQEPRMKNE